MIFEGLSDKLQGALSKLKSKGKLTEKDVKDETDISEEDDEIFDKIIQGYNTNKITQRGWYGTTYAYKGTRQRT